MLNVLIIFILIYIILQNDDDFDEIPDSDKTPVTIVTGFLGSGNINIIMMLYYQ